MGRGVLGKEIRVSEKSVCRRKTRATAPGGGGFQHIVKPSQLESPGGQRLSCEF